MRTLEDDVTRLSRLLARREKQLARVLRTARRDAAILLDIVGGLTGNNTFSIAQVINLTQSMDEPRNTILYRADEDGPPATFRIDNITVNK